MLKLKFRKSLVGCMDDIVHVVNESAHTIHVELVGREDGTVFVTVPVGRVPPASSLSHCAPRVVKG